jgi:hypothetical protein
MARSEIEERNLVDNSEDLNKGMWRRKYAIQISIGEILVSVGIVKILDYFKIMNDLFLGIVLCIIGICLFMLGSNIFFMKK